MTQAQQHNDGEMLPIQTLFSYDVLDAETRYIAQTIADRIRQRNISMTQAYIDNGKDLLAIKERLPRGQWGPWLQDEFNWSPVTASQMMRIARLFGHLQLAESNVSINALHLLSQHDVPSAIREAASGLIESGHVTTGPEVIEIVAQHDSRLAERLDATDAGSSIKRARQVAHHLSLQIAEVSFAVRNIQMAIASSYGVPLRADVANALERLQYGVDGLIQLAPQEQHGTSQGTKRPNTSSQYVGVALDKKRGKWRARINDMYKLINIGWFTTEEEAARAYDAKARELYGDQARLNFPEETP